jgi:hypothetical protein
MGDAQVVLSFIAAATALAAVFLGPFLAARASKNGMLGPMRQAWINDLRDTVAEFSARIAMGYDAVSAVTRDENAKREVVIFRVTHIQTTAQLLSKIELLINPKEVAHQEIVRMARVAFDVYQRGGGRPDLTASLIEQTQSVLKKEWDVVKA